MMHPLMNIWTPASSCDSAVGNAQFEECDSSSEFLGASRNDIVNNFKKQLMHTKQRNWRMVEVEANVDGCGATHSSAG